MKSVIIFLFIFIFTQSCDNNNNNILPPNNALTLGFSDTNDLYSRINRDSINFGYWIDSLVFYYNNKGEKIFQNKYIIISLKLNFPPFYFLNLGEITEKSAGLTNIKNWYIQWPKGKIDTLFADYFTDLHGPNNCNCSTPLKELKLNGKKYLEKTNYDKNGIFVFDW